MDQLVEDLMGNFETTYRLATEMPSSPLYKENGYWLGPIWAPVAYLFIDSLKSYGYSKVGERIKEK